MAQVLVLNASFEPLSKPMSLKRAVRLVLQDKAEVLETDEKEIRTVSGSMPRPAVIKLKKFVKVPAQFRKKVNNVFLFARDNYTCQYCGKHEKQLPHRQGLTRDHILPVSRGGKDVWTNVAAACSPCNARKDNKLPHEAGMRLLTTPVEPMLVHLKWQVRKLTPMQAKYITMFYGESWLKQMK